MKVLFEIVIHASTDELKQYEDGSPGSKRGCRRRRRSLNRRRHCLKQLPRGRSLKFRFCRRICRRGGDPQSVTPAQRMCGIAQQLVVTFARVRRVQTQRHPRK